MCKCGCAIGDECVPEYCNPNFKMGDKVYSPIYGYGVVTNVYPDNIDVCFTRAKTSTWFLSNGKKDEAGDVVLFHGKPTIIPPKKKVKKWLWAFHWNGMEMPLITTKHKSAKEMQAQVDSDRIRAQGGYKAFVALRWTEIEVEE